MTKIMRIMTIRQYFLLACIYICLPALVLADEADHPAHYSWQAQVIDDHGHPIPYANVVVLDLNRGGVSDEAGYVKLDHLPAGTFEIGITVIGYVHKSIQVVIPQSGRGIREVVLEHTILEGTAVTVSVTGLPTDVLHSERTVSVLEGNDLQRSAGQSLSSTINAVPGVQMQAQGHAVNKPVIRGLTNQRIVILKDGIRLEGQQWGGHHTPEADVLSIGRIEVVRGPMGLIYGSDALGGVIQLQSPDLQTLDEGGERLQVAFRTGFHANSQQGVGGIGVQKAWQRSALRVNTSGRWSDDYAAPGDGKFLDRVPGTAFEQLNLNVHIVQKFTGHELEVLGSHYQEEQTLIGEGHWHNTGGGADGSEPWFHVLGEIKSPTKHQNLTLKGKLIMQHSWLEYDAGVQQNYRQGGPAGVTPVVDITTSTHSANIRWRHVVQDKLPGTIGVSYLKKNSKSIGVERLLPDYVMNTAGLFSYYRWRWRNLTFSGGLRLDVNQYNILISQYPSLSTKEDVTLEHSPITSGSLGLVWHQVEKPYSVAFNVGTGWRPPNPYELYINGIHHGDWKIERGDADLTHEQAVNADIIFRHVNSSHSGELTFFYNQMQNYIFSSPAGDRDPSTGIPIYQITQGDARTLGSEMRLEYLISDHVQANMGWDVIWGELLETGMDADGDGQIEQSLPSMNPPRVLLGLEYELEKIAWFKDVNLEIEGEHVFAQNNLAEMENLIDDYAGGFDFIEPKAYGLLNIAAHGMLDLMGSSVDLTLGIDNVLNTKYYSHLSRYKGMVYDQGFNLYGEIRLKL